MRTGRRSTTLNVMSGVRLSRAYLPRMKQQNWGRIIFISSESALADSGGEHPLRHDEGRRDRRGARHRGDCAKTGITVNSVLPGPTRDPRTRVSRTSRSAWARTRMAEAEAEFINSRRPTSLIKRFARPDEVASLIAYVASPLSRRPPAPRSASMAAWSRVRSESTPHRSKAA